MNIQDSESPSQPDARMPEMPALDMVVDGHNVGGTANGPEDTNNSVSSPDGTSTTQDTSTETLDLDSASGASLDTGTGVGPQPKAPGRHAFREIIETIVITLVVFVLVRLVIQNFRVDGDSMLPTLHSDQYLLVNKALYFRYDSNFFARIFDPNAQPDMHYLFHGPQRGDIVVFLSPTEPIDFIKRVIATEGETVEIKADLDPVGDPNQPCGDCGVFVNGVKLDEPYIKATPNYSVGPLVVPQGDIYVLGDNRRNSSDSHVWGPLDVGSIVGEAFLSYWPTSEWGLLPHPSYAQGDK